MRAISRPKGARLMVDGQLVAQGSKEFVGLIRAVVIEGIEAADLSAWDNKGEISTKVTVIDVVEVER